jgi:hypothetical protein
MDACPKALSEAAENQKLLSVILEELGISNKVKVLANRLVKQIVSEYEPGYTLKVTPFSEKCGEYTISFNFVDKPRKPASGFKGITFFTRREIRIDGYTVRGKIPADELAEVLQHELKHVFDLYKSGRGGFFKDGKSQQIYIIGATQATNKSLPIEQRAIGYAIYLSYDFESQAFESGTYAYLMKQNLHFIGDEAEAVKNSMYYKRLLYVRYAYDFANENKEEAEDIAKAVYGKSYNWLKRTVSASLKMTRRQIGRAVAKVRNDYDWAHGGNSTVWA